LQVIATLPALAECAMMATISRGQAPMCLAVLKTGMTITVTELQQQLITRIRDTIDDPGAIPEIIAVLLSEKSANQIGLASG
jgi:hypothetical protein